MPIRMRHSPPEARDVLAQGLLETRGPIGGGDGHELAEAETGEPLPVFVTTPEEILAGNFLDDIAPVGWSFIVFAGASPTETAELAQGVADQDLKFSHTTRGPFAEATALALEDAEGRLELVDQDFEPRLLRCPSIYLNTIWLHASGRDLFMPLHPTNKLLQEKEIYEKEDFIERVSQAARLSLEQASLVNPESPPANVVVE